MPGSPARWTRLPFSFDPELLRADLRQVMPDEWMPHYNQADYEGEWSGVALRSVGGSAAQLFSTPGATEFRETPILDRCPYFRHVMSRFECPMKAIRLLRLGPGSRILEHTDYGLTYDDGDARFHVPIETNPETEFVVAGRCLPLSPGEAWYVDFSLPHRIHNRGDGNRVHLVLDGCVNAWTDAVITAGEHPAGDAARPASDFESFRELVFQDPELRERLLEERRPDAFFRLAEALGRERGFSFTATDVEVAHRAGKRAWLEKSAEL